MNDTIPNKPSGHSPDPLPAPQSAPVFAASVPVNQPQQMPVYSNPPRRNRGLSTGAIIGISIIAAICIVLVVSIASCTSMVSGVTSSFGLDHSSVQAASSDGTPKVAVINMEGTIQYDNNECSPYGLRALLRQAEERDDIKAVVLRVNSGGGTATAGEEMARYVKDFEKPIVVSSASTNASAAYEISSQADYIFTAKTTSIGSIGVALQVTDLSGLYRMLGINIENITSAGSKDASYGTRPLSDSERAWYQEMVNQIDADFVQTVAEGRDMKVDEVRNLANGLAYTGMDAVENGLADEIGYFEDAVAHASELAGHSDVLNTTTLTLSSSSSLSALLDVLGEGAGSKDADDQAIEALVSKYGDPS